MDVYIRSNHLHFVKREIQRMGTQKSRYTLYGNPCDKDVTIREHMIIDGMELKVSQFAMSGTIIQCFESGL